MRPAAILLFRQGAIIQQADMERVLRYRTSETPYELRQRVGEDKSALVLTYLLLLFLRRQIERAPGFNSRQDVWIATEQFLVQNTVLVERTTREE